MSVTNLVKSTASLQQNTQTSFVTLTLITQACHGILNTVFIAPTPKPIWFDELNKKLNITKTNAADWINNLAPAVTSSVPVQVINYGTTYDALSAQIQSIANEHPDAQGTNDPYVLQVHQLVSALDNSVTDIITNVNNTSEKLKAWGILMQESHDDLYSGVHNIQNAETDLSTDIAKMNNAITDLNDSIYKENIVIAVSAGGIGVGLLLLIGGIALAPETGGLSLVVAGTGGLLIIGGSVTWGVMQAKIDKQFGEIATDQQELDDDQRQLVALQGLSAASNQSIQYVTDSTNFLSDFRTSWNIFQGELQDVKAKLESAEDSLSVIVSSAFTDAAKTEWDLATAFAQSLATAPVQVVVKQLPMNSTLMAA